MNIKSVSIIMLLLFVGVNWTLAQDTYLFLEQDKVVSEAVFTLNGELKITGVTERGAGYSFDPKRKILSYGNPAYPFNNNEPFVTPFNAKEGKVILGQQIYVVGPIKSHQSLLYASSQLPVTWQIDRGTKEYLFDGLPEPLKDTETFEVVEVTKDGTVHVKFNGELFVLKHEESRKFSRKLRIAVNRAQLEREGRDAAYGDAVELSYTIEDTFTNFGRIPRIDLVHQKEPDIFGDKVVFLENGQGNWEIVLADITLGTKTTLVSNEFPKMKPSIYGNTVVWQEYRNDNWDIYAININTKFILQVTNDNKDQVNPDIWGNIIVWEDYRNQRPILSDRFEDFKINSDIYMYDLRTNTMEQITADESRQYNPQVYERWVTWDDERGDGKGIYVYDLIAQQEDYIPADDLVLYPRIFSDTIAAFEYNRAKGQGNIRIYKKKGPLSLIVGETSSINLTSRILDNPPAIDRNRIVWEKRTENGHWAIYMYDVVSRSEVQITDGESDSRNPSIYGDIIVWEDSRNGNTDIYLLDLNTNQQKRVTNL